MLLKDHKQMELNRIYKAGRKSNLYVYKDNKDADYVWHKFSGEEYWLQLKVDDCYLSL